MEVGEVIKDSIEKSGLIYVILTSALTASILSVVVSAIVSFRLKNLDYKNEYYKKILEKRLGAYGFLEAQIAVLTSTAVGKDGKPYYFIFANGEEKFDEYQRNLFLAMSYSMWINDVTVEHMGKLNDIYFKILKEIKGGGNEEVVETGKNITMKSTK